MATNISNLPLRGHYGYKLRSGRRVLGTIKPAETRNVYLWHSNFTKDSGFVTGLDKAIDIVLKEARMSLRLYEIDLEDIETGKRRSLNTSQRDKGSRKRLTQQEMSDIFTLMQGESNRISPITEARERSLIRRGLATIQNGRLVATDEAIAAFRRAGF